MKIGQFTDTYDQVEVMPEGYLKLPDHQATYLARSEYPELSAVLDGTFATDVLEYVLEQEINNPSPVAVDYFGYSVSINSDGSRAAIGAYMEDTGAPAAGSVYIYSRSGTTWTLEQEINNPTPVAGDQFGYSVSINSDGSRVAIGAYNEDTGASDAGSVYIYYRTDTTWALEQEINNPTPVASDRFGYSVSINSEGSRVAIGAYQEDTGADAAGSVYIYSRSDTTWTLEQEINNPTPVSYENFGQSVSINSDGSRVIIGAIYEGTGALSAGSVYIYSRTDATWTLEQEINNPTPVTSDYFGNSVSISSDGSRVAIGASGEDTGADAAGSVYIYSRTDTTWTLEQEINNPTPVSYDSFGNSVSINSDGSKVAIGASGEDTGASGAGSVYIFSRTDTTWTLEQEINNPTPVSSDNFGYSVSINSEGSRVIIGAYQEDTGDFGAGSAYIYDYTYLQDTDDLKVQALPTKHTLKVA